MLSDLLVQQMNAGHIQRERLQAAEQRQLISDARQPMRSPLARVRNAAGSMLVRVGGRMTQTPAPVTRRAPRTA